jgi:hypothetical protein
MAKTPWWKMSTIRAVPRLIQIRKELRDKNLHDTEDQPLNVGLPPIDQQPLLRFTRTPDGSYNDLKYPRMGMAGARFGRNFPLKEVFPDKAKLMSPSPRLVSQELMTRHQFQPVPFLNLLAASWIQFQVHDWFVHRNDEAAANWHEIPLAPGDAWPGGKMRVAPTQVDPSYSPASGKPPVYQNHSSHWWDASQIYGSDGSSMARLRTGVDGKLKLEANGRLMVDPATGIDLTGFTDNWWLGLAMLHALFTAEHNRICDELKKRNPGWSEEHLYVKARLINAALIAKIHTIEWTPAIMPHPTVQLAMRVNWRGVLGGLQNIFGFLNDSELLGGIVGSSADHHSAPYSLTEEFVCVYRMHSLMPDEFTIRSIETGAQLAHYQLPEVSGRKTRAELEKFSLTDLFYSFGRMHPGMIRLHNYPKHLQNLVRDNGERFDMAAVDILRDRERGVPRYNKFRELLRMDRITRFEDLTDHPQWAAEIKRVYNGQIDDVDTQVGLQCEPLPPGFGFSESAFRIFVLMASRRLKSDRFFTDDYTAEMYTKFGLDWIDENSMKSVLLRHMPHLDPALANVANAFNPWNDTTPKK